MAIGFASIFHNYALYLKGLFLTYRTFFHISLHIIYKPKNKAKHSFHSPSTDVKNKFRKVKQFS